MYKDLYGFQHMPFATTMDFDLDKIHLSKNFEMPLAILVSSLDKGISLTLVLAAHGVGKTTFINYLRKYIEQDFAVGLVNGRLQTVYDLLQHTLTSFGSEFINMNVDEMLQQLNDILASKLEKQNQQPPLLIIDNADNIAIDALKGIKLLLDLNNENTQLLQVVLVGRHHLLDLLNTAELQGLLVGTQCLLEPLTREETQSYIDHRLNIAGMSDQQLFDEEVCSTIFKYSGGIPKRINLICDKALLRSSADKKQVSVDLIYKVVKTIEHKESHKVSTENITLESIESLQYKTGLRLSNSILLTGGLFTGIILILIFASDSIFLSREDQQVKVSAQQARISKELVGSSSVEKKYEIKIPDTMLTQPDKTEFPENQLDKKTVNDKILQSKKLAQIATENQLVIAASYLQSLQLTSPEGKNALEIYRSILENEPENKAARQGVKQVAEKYRNLAVSESSRGKYDKAITFLEKAAKILPESKDIRQALTETRKRNNEKETEQIKFEQASDSQKKTAIDSNDQKVLNMLAIANMQVASSKFILPQSDNAYKTFQAILAIDNNHPQSIQGIQKIQQQLISQLQNARDKNDFVSMHKISEKVLSMPSYGVGDQHHEEATFAALETKKIVEDKLEKLLNLAKQQRKTQHLAQPTGDNAIESYRKILKINPASKVAKKGLDSLVKQYQAMVNDAISDGKTDLAIAIANEGIKAFPNNNVLNVLRDNAEVKKDTDVKETEEKPTKKREQKKLRPFANF